MKNKSIIFLCVVGVLSTKSFAKTQLFLFPRDPFEEVSITLVQSTISPSKNIMYEEGTLIKLDGIVWDKLRPTAIIKVQNMANIVSTGSQVGNIEIEKISKKEVSLKVNNKNYILKLGKEIRL